MQEIQEMWIWTLAWEDPLEKEMATHSSIIARKIPWTEAVHGVAESQTLLSDWAHAGKLEGNWRTSMHCIWLEIGTWDLVGVAEFHFYPRNVGGPWSVWRCVCVLCASVCILHTFSCCLRGQRHGACDSAGSHARLVWTMVQLLGRHWISLQVT